MTNLLNPRYRVIADWPGNELFITGEILNAFNTANECEQYEGIGTNALDSYWHFDKYPHLFKKLEWWKYRKPEEMPEYIKGVLESKEVFLKKELIENGFKYKWLGRDGYNMMHISKFMPSDESEYKQSLWQSASSYEQVVSSAQSEK